MCGSNGVRALADFRLGKKELFSIDAGATKKGTGLGPKGGPGPDGEGLGAG